MTLSDSGATYGRFVDVTPARAPHAITTLVAGASKFYAQFMWRSGLSVHIWMRIGFID
jgi:hypothetical protein